MFNENPADDYFKNQQQHILSPAEKYDLLTGLKDFPLTKKMWSEGKKYYEAYGEVEGWMGICHGWAPAAFMVEEPKKMIEVNLPLKDTTIKIFPHDIKGLASQLWASSQFKTGFLGGRCNDQDPQMDENGRIIDKKCFDTNPGIWHIVTINQIGISRRSFIMDATYDYQV